MWTTLRTSDKRAEERGIFERFAEVANLDVVPGAIEQPDPQTSYATSSALGASASSLQPWTMRQNLRAWRDPIQCRRVVHDHPPFVATRCQRPQPSM
jgi:hypothetical protein